MADGTRDEAPKAGGTLDLSTGKAPRRRKRKGPPALVHETINLSTKRAPAEPAPPPRPERAPRTPRGKAPKAASSSLADLLDPDTLARLRGD